MPRVTRIKTIPPENIIPMAACGDDGGTASEQIRVIRVIRSIFFWCCRCRRHRRLLGASVAMALKPDLYSSTQLR
jgi:hypothetical protein